MSKKTYYEILGVSKTATPAELKIAHRKKARQWHPDFYVMELDGKKHEAEEMIKIINEAYNVLSDSFKRSSYDLDLSRGLGFVSIPDCFSQEKKQENSYHSSNYNTSKTAEFAFDNELKDILKLAIEKFKNTTGYISISDSIILYAISKLCNLRESFTKEEIDLMDELKKVVHSNVCGFGGFGESINYFDKYNENPGTYKKY
ncbi:MAG: DnaJ domain-containing protein [Bacilli bacterium]|nr:DnaJ domain-containing protein [Bacilli bacterium]MCI9435247.1 DnaJ domain-containing protein [Bacilli bacterium]